MNATKRRLQTLHAAVGQLKALGNVEVHMLLTMACLETVSQKTILAIGVGPLDLWHQVPIPCQYMLELDNVVYKLELRLV